MIAVPAELCFVGIQSPAEGDVVFSNTAPSCPEGTWTLPSAYCSNAFLFPFLRAATTGPNAIFFGSFLPGSADESECVGWNLGPE